MLALYSAHHSAHAPRYDYLHGRIVPYFEMPSRVEVIKANLEAADLITCVEPELLLTRSILGESHAPEMIDQLEHFSQKAHGLAVKELLPHGFEVSDDEYYYQAIFPREIGLSDGVIAYHGLYGFDYAAPIGKHTWSAAFHSANLAYIGATQLLKGEQQVYALCRPPGHHAGRHYIGGYCYFNNAAVAANALKSQGRVAILDIDYHHGNGTQDIFWNDPDVLFISIHADPTIDYPLFSGYAQESGGDNVEGTIFNIPLPHGTGEMQYMEAISMVLDKIARFHPHALIVSLGFDTFKDDPICDFRLEIESYRKIGGRIASLGLPTVYVQEGGYHINSLDKIAISFFQGVQE